MGSSRSLFSPFYCSTSHSHDVLHVFDDFREAYAWLSHNTEKNDKVSSIGFHYFFVEMDLWCLVYNFFTDVANFDCLCLFLSQVQNLG
ncbi:hypothetical protein AAZX31_U035600 [Glycine max]